MNIEFEKYFLIFWFIAFTVSFSVYVYVHKKILVTKYQTGLNIQILGFIMILAGALLGFAFDYLYVSTKIGGLGILVSGYGVLNQILHKK
jgi:hypothetical protein